MQQQLTAASPQSDTSIYFNDDPIAAMLDSLARFKYFEKGYMKPPFQKTSKYHFSPDSVPKYDEATYAARLAKLDVQSPFSLQYNNIVKGYIELYTVRRRELVSRIMGLSQLYFPIFEETLDKYKLPLEFKYLAICESALNPNARSRAGAVGLWQFMYPTGKMYDLKVSSYVDERCDPYQATVAACEYFQFLYDMFGDWEMVLAAYNGGPGTVNKAIRRSGGKRTYWEIRPYLPVETQGYVPAFIAVNYVMNYTAEHNLYSSIPKKMFFQVDTVKTQEQLTFEQISAVLDIPVEEIQYLNPSYKRNIIPTPNPEPYTLCLPSSKIGSFITNEAAIYNYLKKDTTTSQNILAAQEIMKIHTVRRGEHLNTIANRYKCTVSDLKIWNNLKSLAVKPGQKLTVYITPKNIGKGNTSVIVKTQAAVTPPPSASISDQNKDAVTYKYYIIQNGDTLWNIAKNNGITIAEIKRLNNLTGSYKLQPGKKIKVGISG